MRMPKGNRKRAARGKVPKRIAGAKVPKALRKSGIARWALSTEGREIIGGILLAGATALTSGKPSTTSRKTKDGGSSLQEAGQALAKGVADLIGGAVSSPTRGTERRTRSDIVRPRNSPH